jgi:hypothetical protein
MCKPGSPPCGGMKSHNFDTRGRELPHAAGYYLIPADQFATVVAQRRWNPAIMNCFPFVPLQASGPACPPCPSPPPAPRVRRR